MSPGLHVTLLLMLCGAQAEARQSSPPSPQPAGSWILTLTTRGGFTGKGIGGMTATSDGYVTVDRLGRSRCRLPLSPADVELLARVVAEAKPTTWTPSYLRSSNPPGCCHHFRYSLTLQMHPAGAAVRKYRTSWYSEMSEALPADVHRLFEAAWKIKKESDATCNRR